jgi:hypothetical protein
MPALWTSSAPRTAARRHRRTAVARDRPDVPEDVAAVLRSELMSARRAVGAALRSGDAGAEAAARARVHRTKTALGERGTPWWEQTPEQRRQRWEAGLPGLDA